MVELVGLVEWGELALELVVQELAALEAQASVQASGVQGEQELLDNRSLNYTSWNDLCCIGHPIHRNYHN
jgi:hypothetical protein